MDLSFTTEEAAFALQRLLHGRIDHLDRQVERNAAVDKQRLPRDIPAGLGGKKDDGPLQIVGPPGPLDGDSLGEVRDQDPAGQWLRKVLIEHAAKMPAA